MSKRKHPADLATAEAIANADYFTVSLLHDGAHETHELRTLEQAREAGALMEQLHPNGRRSIVYAVTEDIVPRCGPAN